jgi:hypothetical protein
MIIDFDHSLNILFVLMVAGLSCYAGWWWRSRQLKRKQRRILELEHEMMQAHAELLEVQKEYCELESRIRDLAIPVIPLKQVPKEEDGHKEQRIS